MNLELEKYASNFQKIKSLLRAPTVSVKSSGIPPIIESIDDLAQMLKNTVLIDGIWTDGKEPFVLYCKNQVSFLYGKERVVKQGDVWLSEYRYHICQCKTIDGFLRKRQLDGKYTKFNPGYGKIPYATVDGEDHMVKMRVCQNCLEQIGYKGYKISAPVTPAKLITWFRFDVVAYIKEKGILDLPDVKDSIGDGKYPDTWDDISKWMRERIPYCEFCGSTNDLQVHHIDANPSNCIDNNLIVLCKSCHERLHSKQHLTFEEDKKLEERQHGIFPF